MLRYWFSERTHWLADVFGLGTASRDRPVDVRSNGEFIEAVARGLSLTAE